MEYKSFWAIVIGSALLSLAAIILVVRSAVKNGNSVVMRERPEDETLGIGG